MSDWAGSLDLQRYLRLGRSDEGSHRRTRLLASTFEAVVGAIYADRGLRVVEGVKQSGSMVRRDDGFICARAVSRGESKTAS